MLKHYYPIKNSMKLSDRKYVFSLQLRSNLFKGNKNDIHLQSTIKLSSCNVF